MDIPAQAASAAESLQAVRSSPSFGPELMIAIVRPVGTPDDRFHQAIAGALLSYGYQTKKIKLSQIIADEAETQGRSVPHKPEDDRINALMDEGDKLCARYNSAASLGLLAVSEIRDMRTVHHSASDQPAEHGTVPIPRTAYVIDSVKRPAEVTQLQMIYGDHLILIGLQASPKTRLERLQDMIRPQRVSKTPSEIVEIARSLIERDYAEGADYGQNTVKTFPMADVFIDVDGDVNSQVDALVDLLFGSPDYKVPSPEEFGMHLAYVSGTRSPELGLKVGAVIIRNDGNVVSFGMNAHPNPTGTPAYDSSSVDIHELLIDTLQRISESALNDVARSHLEEEPDDFARELLAGPLRTSKIKDITEFQLTVHAEMDALISALRCGASVEGSTLYVTAYPCHNCAKHLLALGIKVKYLEPYPKSRAAAMYGPDIDATFLPFTGIAPRRYQQLFNVTEDRKNPDGSRRTWSNTERQTAEPKVSNLLDPRGIAIREAGALSAIFRTT